MTLLRAVGLFKGYGPEGVLADVHLDLNEGETMAVLGHSGSGKSTLLRVLAGLEPGDAGQVWLRDRDVTRWPPEARSMVYLYQEPLLFPHLSAFENVAFGLRLRKGSDSEVRLRTEAMLEALSMAEHRTKMPAELSGGQRQRIAFGRAFVVEPEVLLLDEPFSSLDARTRGEMQELFVNACRQQRLTSMFVTHDVKEALQVGTRFSMLRERRLFRFPDRHAFLTDDAVGAERERSFWERAFREPETAEAPGGSG